MKILLIIAVSCFVQTGASAQAPSASIVELIANPDSFNGKSVRIQGVINIGFENNSIYLSKEHWKHSITSCGIWMEIESKLAEERKWGNGKYFLIEGIFHADRKGHMGLFRGTISNIKMIQLHEVIDAHEAPKK